MKKIFCVLLMFWGINLGNLAMASPLVSQTDFVRAFFSFSSGEAYNLFLNKKTYPDTYNFLYLSTKLFQGALVQQLHEDDDMNYDVAELSYKVYRMDTEDAMAKYFDLVERGIIKGKDSYFASISVYFIVCAIAQFPQVDEPLEDLIKLLYPEMYKKFSQGMEMGAFLSLMDNVTNDEGYVQQNLYFN